MKTFKQYLGELMMGNTQPPGPQAGSPQAAKTGIQRSAQTDTKVGIQQTGPANFNTSAAQATGAQSKPSSNINTPTTDSQSKSPTTKTRSQSPVQQGTMKPTDIEVTDGPDMDREEPDSLEIKSGDTLGDTEFAKNTKLTVQPGADEIEAEDEKGNKFKLPKELFVPPVQEEIDNLKKLSGI